MTSRICQWSLLIGNLVAFGTAWALDPTALPTDAQVQSGSASVSQSGPRMDINQSSQNAIINWGSFNIGVDAQVNFSQPSSSAIALNRVNAASGGSEIAGQLNANGMMFLVNPAGVLFSSSAQVNVGGLVASTLDIGDADFLEGRYVFTNDGSAREVANFGNIVGGNGTIALLAPTVRNEGTLSAAGGSVALGAGNSVRLELTGNKLIGFEVDQAALAASITNAGLITANGGQVLLTAKAAGDLAATAINNTGIIEALTVESVAGTVRLVAEGGSISMSSGGLINGGSIVAENIFIDTPTPDTGIVLEGDASIGDSSQLTLVGSDTLLPSSAGNVSITTLGTIGTASSDLTLSGGSSSLSTLSPTLTTGTATLSGGITEYGTTRTGGSLTLAAGNNPLPSPSIVAGSATPGGAVNIDNNGSVTNWNTFSISADQSTKFLQPSASSSVLNRVLGQDRTSLITGQLQSNGKVYLLSPSGDISSYAPRQTAEGFAIDKGASVRMGVAPVSISVREQNFSSATLIAAGTGSIAPDAGLSIVEGAGLQLPRGIE